MTTALLLTGENAASAQSPGIGVPHVSQWNGAGQNTANTRYAANEFLINKNNAKNLKPRWTATLKGNVVATPTVYYGTAYVPDYGGMMNAVNTATGKLRWSKPISTYSGVTDDVSRTSPVVVGNNIIFGDGVSAKSAQIGSDGEVVFQGASSNGARIMAANRTTGAKVWTTLVEAHKSAIITGSPTVIGNTILVGVSSRAEFENTDEPSTFKGSIAALDATTGKILWKKVLAPEGYTGNAVWGSAPPADPASGLAYFATGNNYGAPAGVCTKPDQPNCTQPPEDDYSDSVLAVDIKTGAIKWAFKTLTSDVGQMDCDTCGPDFDFGTSPNLYTATIGGKSTKVIGIGQKSGVYYALDAGTGKLLWKTIVGPGSDIGGMEWGTAVDGSKIYTAISNVEHEEYEITSSTGVKSTINGGSWAALDAATGKILWQTADPYGALDNSFVSAANGVVYSGDTKGDQDSMFALDANTGNILWRFKSGGSVTAGAAIVDGNVYWGSGYWVASCPVLGDLSCGANNKLYAFSPFSTGGTNPTPTASPTQPGPPPATTPPATTPPVTTPPTTPAPPHTTPPAPPTSTPSCMPDMPGMPGNCPTSMPGMPMNR